MGKAIFRVSIVLVLVCSFFYRPLSVVAQIAPTSAATISGSVSDSAGKPVANAKVSLSGPKSTSTETDTNGLFVFVGVPFGTYSIAAAAVGLGTAMRTNVSVQDDTNVAIQYEPASANGLKVIANVSSSTNASFNVSPASITQVNPMTSAFEGETSWRTILEQIPGVAQAGLLNGQINHAAFPDSPQMPMQVSINGGLPYETATLLDDMPLISGNPNAGALAGAGTDLSYYPLNGFGSADVVRGPGAAAPSIVDSIGGSFVLHAPGAVDQNRYTLSLSTDPYGGIVANAQAALHWKKFSAVVTYGVNTSPGPISGADIPGFTAFSPNTIDGNAFSCTGSCALTRVWNPNYAVASGPLTEFTNGLLVCCYQDTSAWNQHSGSIALNYELSPSVSASIFYAGQKSQLFDPYQGGYTVFTPPAGYTGSLSGGPHVFQLDGLYLAPLPEQNTTSLLEEKITARIGSGVLRFAALQNRVISSQSVSTPASATQQLFGGGAYCTNPSCTTTTPAVFNGGLYDVTYTSYNSQCSNWSDNRDLLFSYATPLGENLHAGASFVRSYYDIPSQDVYSYGAPYNFGGESSFPSSVSQTTNEFRVFVGGTPSLKTSIDLSMYFVNAGYHVQNPNDLTGNTYVDERYSYAAPRLGFVWRPIAEVAVRASAGGGFAEAPLNDLVGSNGAITPTVPPGAYSQTLTNLNLQPEKSFGFDLGTDIRLRHNTILSFDVYHTNLYGQFYNSTTITGTYLGLPLYTTQYGNLGESRYEGALLDVRHDVPHGIYWSLSGGLTRGYVVSVPDGFYNGFIQYTTIPCTKCANLTVVPGINFNGTFTGVSVPYSQALGRLGYRWNVEKYVDLVGTYYGNNNTYFRPAFVELDGHIGYPLTKNASLLVTFRNITGIYAGPEQVLSGEGLLGVPTVSGLPYVESGEEYGPRTVLITTKLKL